MKKRSLIMIFTLALALLPATLAQKGHMTIDAGSGSGAGLSSGMIGITTGQTARLSVWNGGDKAVAVRLLFIDGDGKILLVCGSVEADVSLNQLDAGMGMLTLLDGFLPSRVGLARLSNLPVFYFDPEAGLPALQAFVDTTSADSSRLFGQGAGLGVRRYTVSSRRSRND